MRSVFVAIGMIALLTAGYAAARADDYVLTIKDHRFAPTEIKVPANPVLSLGLHMDIGQVSAIRKGSPAEGKFQKLDKITHLESSPGKLQAIGRDIDPPQ